MRIQEMRSGLAHLKKGTVREPHYDQQEIESIFWPDAERETVEASPAASELDDARWSLVSFDQIEAGGLTYRQADELMTMLDGHGIAGLCVVTDEAAARIRS